MLEKLKKRLRKMIAGTPGRRFQDKYHRQHAEGDNNLLRKILFLGGGTAVFAAGIFFLPAPGPGFVIVFLGAGMVAQESLVIARFLDAAELKGRRAAKWGKDVWTRMSTAARASLIAAAAVLAGGAAYLAWIIMMR